MPYVITLITPSQAPILPDAPLRALEKAGVSAANPRILGDGRAIDIEASIPASKSIMDAVREEFSVDIFWQDAATRTKRLFVADMEATIIEQEMLDELAGLVGQREKTADITARTMNGELDFAAALRERVALLKGLPESVLAETAKKITASPGVTSLIKTLKDHGVHCILVSGGFTCYTRRVAEMLGFDAQYGNILEVAGGHLTGTVANPILDKNAKKKYLEDTAARLGIPLSQTVAIGDGANDLGMLQTAGLGVGWRSKRILRDALPNHILLCGMDALIYGLGFPQSS